MISLRRTDTSIVGRWWWTVDRWALLALALLVALGIILILAASPPVAARLRLDTFHFVRRQIGFAVPACLVLMLVSYLNPIGIRRLAIAGFLGSIALLALTLFFGTEINGARRWLDVGGFVLQPSEFAKPFFIVVTAYLLAKRQTSPSFPAIAVSALMLALVLAFLLLQPDFGMAVVVCAVWLAQVFMAGLPLGWLVVMGALGIAGLGLAYALLPHVASRIDRFLDPASGDSFQIETAREAFMQGGLFGRGPGEGVVKNVLPDAHTDFIFAVAGEEFGAITCMILIALFAFVVLRGFARALQTTNYFVLLASAGLLIQFGAQAAINIGVNLHLMPTKGMTLPFISYGGSSLMALALLAGMVLALTRHRADLADDLGPVERGPGARGTIAGGRAT